ncbi:MAG: superinfection immunity protein [Rickettsiales bacterium]|nr:superinfection immunity protein [Rickettsiales bacterium]
MLILKYAAGAAIIVGIFLAPAWLARINGKAKYDMMVIRMASWAFGWTGIGWLLALFWSVRK